MPSVPSYFEILSCFSGYPSIASAHLEASQVSSSSCWLTAFGFC